MSKLFGGALRGLGRFFGDHDYDVTSDEFDSQEYKTLTKPQQEAFKKLCGLNFNDTKTQDDMMRQTEQALNQLEADAIPLRLLLGHNASTNILYQATKNRYEDVVKLLLDRGADISLLFCHNPIFHKRDLSIFFDCIFSKLLDERVKIFGEQETIDILHNLLKEQDKLKQTECVLSLCQIRFEFGKNQFGRNIVGNQMVLENQTETFAKLIRLELITAYTLEHPFIQVFVDCKYNKFRKLLQLSMLVQISWSAACAVFIFCNSHIQTSTNVENTSRTSNLTELCNPILINDPTTLRLRFPAYLYLILFLLAVSIGKEILEFKSSWPNYRYYFKQLSNVGEWIVHFAIFIVFIMACVPGFMGVEDNLEYTNTMEKYHHSLWFWFLPGIYMSGIFASLLLIQGQLNKTKSLGKYVAMFNSGFRNIMKFILAFFPFLLGFLIIFHILQPTRNQFLPSWGLGFAKLLAMMTGEIDSDGMFYGEDEDQVAFKNILKITMIIFTITVVILLQNLLVGLSVSDVQKLEEDARVSYLREDLHIRDADNNVEKFRRYDEFPVEHRKALMRWVFNNADKVYVNDSQSGNSSVIRRSQ